MPSGTLRVPPGGAELAATQSVEDGIPTRSVGTRVGRLLRRGGDQRGLSDYFKLSWTLSSIQHVDFSRDFHEDVANLLKVWGFVYRAD